MKVFIRLAMYLTATWLAAFICLSQAFACPNVQKIKTGTSAPCDGWLVTPEKMQDFAKSADELEVSRKLILAQEHLRTLDVAEIEFYKRKTKEAHKQLAQEEVRSGWKTVGAFALGVIVTGFAAKAAIESTR